VECAWRLSWIFLKTRHPLFDLLFRRSLDVTVVGFPFSDAGFVPRGASTMWTAPDRSQSGRPIAKACHLALLTTKLRPHTANVFDPSDSLILGRSGHDLCMAPVRLSVPCARACGPSMSSSRFVLGEVLGQRTGPAG
jgi:hypothetical protein